MGKKKGKIIQLPLSPENYIRTRVRNLPIGGCYIDKDWEVSKIANIIVTRMHSNGNMTIGYYYVDLLLQGLLETDFFFNIESSTFDDIRNSLEEEHDTDQIEIDYSLAHNIIYGAIDFAQEYDFNPPKQFNLTRNILAEDNDEIEIMDIEFGEEGIPVVLVGKENKQQAIITKLERSVGKENFIIYNVDEEGPYYNDINEEENFSKDSESIEKSIEDWDEEDMKDFLAGRKKLNPENFSKLYLSFFYESLNKKGKKEIDDLLDRMENWEIIEDIPENDFALPDEENKLYERLSDKIENDTSLSILNEINEAIKLYPNSFDFGDLKGYCLEKLNLIDEEKKHALSLYKSYPYNVTAFCNFIKLNESKKISDSFFKDSIDLKKLFPGKKNFKISEVVLLINVFVEYYIKEKDYNKAVAYTMKLWDFELSGFIKEIAEDTASLLHLHIDTIINKALKLKKIK